MKLLRSFRASLIVILLFASVLPLAFFGLVFISFLHNHLIREVHRDNLLLARDIRRDTEGYLEEARSALVFLGHTVAASRGEAAIEDLLYQAVAHLSYFESIYLLDREGRVVNLGLPPEFDRHRRDFLGIDFSRHDLFRISSHEGEETWSDTFISPVSGNPSLCYRVRLESGLLLVGNLDLLALSRNLQHYAEFSTAELAIVDHQGVAVAHSSPELVLRRSNLRHQHPEIAGAIHGHELSGIHLHPGGNRLVESVLPLSNPSWVVYIALEANAVLYPVYQVARVAAVVMLVAVGSGVLFTWCSARRLGRPLSALTAGASQIAAGDYDVTLPDLRYTEFGEFAASFTGMAATIRDRQRALQLQKLQLRASEQRYRRLVDSIEGIVWEADIDSCHFTFVSRQAERILGYTAEEWLADPDFWKRQLHPGDRMWVPEECLRLAREKQNYTLEYRMLAANGCTLWLQDIVTVIVQGNKPVRLMGVMIDITWQKQVAARLHESERQYRELSSQLQGLLTGIPDNITLLSADMQVVWTNRKIDFSGAALEDTSIGRLCYEVFGEAAAPCPECPAVACFRSGRMEEVRKTGPDGRTFAMRAFPVRDDAGRVVSVIEIGQDITDQLRMEMQSLRTGQLVALGELAAGVAHEINNPINGIINYAQILLNGAEPGGRQAEVAARIIREGDRIAAIVRELLYFAREGGEEPTPVQLQDVLGETLALIGSQLRKDGIDLQSDFPDDLPPVPAREHQLHQLFMNIMNNSRHALNEKFGSAAGKVIRVVCRPAEDGTRRLRIAFEDNGTGIPAALLPRVMNPFVTTKPAGVGTGLGLSICQEIVDKHGGRIDIESTPGEFTRVVVDLPAC